MNAQYQIDLLTKWDNVIQQFKYYDTLIQNNENKTNKKD